MAKCQKCNGDGKERNYFGVITGLCPRCHGTGEAKPITNEEFLRTATTEQLAEWVVSTNRCKKDHLCSVCRQKWCDKNYVVEWLKQPHKGE